MRPDPILHLTGQLSARPYPSGIGLPGTGEKFTTGGTVEIWPGNTFVCHVARPSPAYAAILEMQERLKQSPFAPFFTYLPAPSFHMTVFQGMSPGQEGLADWPEGVATGAPRDAVSAAIVSRIEDLRLPEFQIKATDLFCAHSLTVIGRDAVAEAALREARATLRQATRIHPPDFDRYVFHITLAYPVTWFSLRLAQEVADFSTTLFADYADALSTIDLDPCAFCNFDTMHHFEPLKALG